MKIINYIKPDSDESAAESRLKIAIRLFRGVAIASLVILILLTLIFWSLVSSGNTHDIAGFGVFIFVLFSGLPNFIFLVLMITAMVTLPNSKKSASSKPVIDYHDPESSSKPNRTVNQRLRRLGQTSLVGALAVVVIIVLLNQMFTNFQGEATSYGILASIVSGPPVCLFIIGGIVAFKKSQS